MMHRPVLRARTFATVGLAALLGIPALAVSPSASAVAGGTGVVISEVYGAGGNAGALVDRDFIELANTSDAPVDLSTWSVQYRSSGSVAAPSGVVTLTGAIPAHGHYLVGMTPGATGSPITPDRTGDVAMSGSAGTVFLADQTSALAAPPIGSVPGRPHVVDLVGYGATNTFETARTAAPSATTSVARAASGADTDDNSLDLTTGAPTPQAGGTTNPPDPGTPQPHPIAEIQGSTDTSPLVGKTVVTDGVVTASYPTGGFRGFYLQTPGTGGAEPATHTASDAVFVFLGTQTAYPALGDHVQVTGKVSEFAGLTEVSPAPGGVVAVSAPAEAVKAVTDAYPGDNAGREALEGMLVAPGASTVSDVYTLNSYGEIKLATGDSPLPQPTDVARPGSPEAAAVVAENARRAVTLDDGSSTNYLTTGKDTPLPWLTRDHPIRVGAHATFTEPVVLDFRNNVWKYQPTGQLTADGTPPATFPNTRTAAPAEVGGALKIASFNVLNYFTETGVDYIARGNTCSSYQDRAGNPITVNNCGPTGPRGAWDDVNLARQQAKTVQAINALGADVLSLEEVANTAKFDGPDHRDDALSTLVDALNADAGSTRWAYVPSPPSAEQPPLEQQDVIRTAFIYRVATAEPVGPSYILTGSTAFSNARQPLAQVFEPQGGIAAQRFLAVMNHFKSKGSGTGIDADTGDGQGASNHSRVLQAQALVDFVDGLKTSTGVGRVFLAGDFNAYTQEDPMKVLADAGYTDLGSRFAPTESTYVFGGLVGSLDHVLANADALATVQGTHVWNINSVESVAYEYSRYHANATDFYAPNPYRSSDHDPSLVGFTIPDPRTPTTLTTRTLPPNPKAGHHVQVRVEVSGGSTRIEGGEVTVSEDGTAWGSDTVEHGTAAVVFTLPAGRHTLTASYAGTDDLRPSTTTVVVDVR